MAVELKRLRGGAPQKVFAQRLGVKLSTYSSYEAGNRAPGAELIGELVRVLGLSDEDRQRLMTAREATRNQLAGRQLSAPEDAVMRRLDEIAVAIGDVQASLVNLTRVAQTFVRNTQQPESPAATPRAKQGRQPSAANTRSPH